MPPGLGRLGEERFDHEHHERGANEGGAQIGDQLVKSPATMFSDDEKVMREVPQNTVSCHCDESKVNGRQKDHGEREAPQARFIEQGDLARFNRSGERVQRRGVFAAARRLPAGSCCYHEIGWFNRKE